MSDNLKWFMLVPILLIAVGLGYVIPKLFGGGDANEMAMTTKQQGQAVQLELSDLQARMDAYQEILKRDPNDLTAIRGLADTYLQMGSTQYDNGDANEAYRSYKASVDQYRRYLALKPDDVEVRIDLGLDYSYLDMFEVAVRELKSVTQAAPTNQRAWHSLGWILASNNKTAEARDAWQKSYNLNPGNAIGQESKQFLDQTGEAGAASSQQPAQ